MICVSNESALKKTNFSSEQLSVSDSYWVRGWGLCLLSLSMWIPSGLDSCRHCARSQSLWIHMCISSAVFTGLVSLVSSILSCSYDVCASQLPELWLEIFDGNIPFTTECSKVSHSLHFVSFWVSAFLPCISQGKLPDDDVCARNWLVSIADYQ